MSDKPRDWYCRGSWAYVTEDATHCAVCGQPITAFFTGGRKPHRQFVARVHRTISIEHASAWDRERERERR